MILTVAESNQLVDIDADGELANVRVEIKNGKVQLIYLDNVVAEGKIHHGRVSR